MKNYLKVAMLDYAKQPSRVTNPKVVPNSILAFPANLTFSSLLLHRQLKINIKQQQQKKTDLLSLKYIDIYLIYLMRFLGKVPHSH